MRLRVLHETRYAYSSPVHAVAMEARLQPCNDEYQSRQRYRLVVSPKTPIEEYSTFSDLQVFYWTMLKASEIHVVSESIVDVRERPLLAVSVPPVELDTMEYYPYLHDTQLTQITPSIEAFASQFARIAAEDWYETALAVREKIHEKIDFEAGHTTTDTTAAELLEVGCGVCQDFTHLMLATLRSLGIPSRYVSGYLNQDHKRLMKQSQSMGDMSQSQELSSEEDMMQAVRAYPLRGTGASHAWCESYFGPEVGWRGFDAANNLLVDQNFVRIGAGRDFRDITPVKGVHKGPAEEDLKVTVSVSRVA
jgi:transglutaminase-like putative cysteine protease